MLILWRNRGNVAFIALILFSALYCLHLYWHRYVPLIVNGKLVMFRESALAHRLLDGKRGIEIGASAHNPYGLNTWNVDYTEEMDAFRMEQIRIANKTAKVHILAQGNRLPFANDSLDFVISSHAIEHFYDPIGAIQEWLRVVKPGQSLRQLCYLSLAKY